MYFREESGFLNKYKCIRLSYIRKKFVGGYFFFVVNKGIY